MKVEEWNFPDQLLYDENHQWIGKEGEEITMGLTDYGQHIRGDILYLSLPESGTMIKAREAIGSLETGKWVGRFYSPVVGRVSAVNEELFKNSRLINSDPYGKGWLFKIKTEVSNELNNLMNVVQLTEWLTNELERERELGSVDSLD